MVNYKQARALAEREAEIVLRNVDTSVFESLLEKDYRFYNGTWMFFRNRDIKMPNEGFIVEFSYLVDNKGNLVCVPDCYKDEEKIDFLLKNFPKIKSRLGYT